MVGPGVGRSSALAWVDIIPRCEANANADAEHLLRNFYLVRMMIPFPTSVRRDRYRVIRTESGVVTGYHGSNLYCIVCTNSSAGQEIIFPILGGNSPPQRGTKANHGHALFFSSFLFPFPPHRFKPTAVTRSISFSSCKPRSLFSSSLSGARHDPVG